ncbi:DinB family protein, partial [Neobacillus drentensis]
PELLSITPRKLLLHTITHECHHKGQIVAMLRQMGYEPPNTDVLGTED